MLCICVQKKYILNLMFNKVILNFYTFVYNNVTCCKNNCYLCIFLIFFVFFVIKNKKLHVYYSKIVHVYQDI